MNPTQVYICSPSWTLLPPPSPYHPSGLSQCTSPKHPVSCIEPGLATHFIHDIIDRGLFCFISSLIQFSSVQWINRVQLFVTPMDHSMPGLPVHHKLPEITQTHVHWVCDAIQSSHPLSSLSPPTFNLSQHQGLYIGQLFTSGGHSIGVSASISVLPMNTQDWSYLWWTGWISLQSKGLSRVFANTTVQKHQFIGTQLSL